MQLTQKNTITKTAKLRDHKNFLKSVREIKKYRQYNEKAQMQLIGAQEE